MVSVMTVVFMLSVMSVISWLFVMSVISIISSSAIASSGMCSIVLPLVVVGPHDGLKVPPSIVPGEEPGTGLAVIHVPAVRGPCSPSSLMSGPLWRPPAGQSCNGLLVPAVRLPLVPNSYKPVDFSVHLTEEVSFSIRTSLVSLRPQRSALDFLLACRSDEVGQGDAGLHPARESPRPRGGQGEGEVCQADVGHQPVGGRRPVNAVSVSPPGLRLKCEVDVDDVEARLLH